jgi:GT2 family glycosyltransferase
MAVTLCMVNYNGERYLEESLKSVFDQKENFSEILLVDNASKDKSLEIIREKFPSVKVIRLNKNLGPGAARNQGFKSTNNNRILFIDNDVSLSTNCAVELIHTLNVNPSAAAAMPRVLYPANGRKNKIQYDGADCHFLGHMILYNGNRDSDVLKKIPQKINSLVTACFLIDREKLQGSNPFDETFFFNYEDHDFGLRIRILGNEILSIPAAICYHREGTEGLSFREGGNYSKMRVFFLIRNRWQIILKNYELKTILLLTPVFIIYEIFQLAGVIKKGWMIRWLKASFWIIFNLNKIFLKRRAIQKARVIPDREILKGGLIPFTAELTKSSLEITAKNFLDFITGAYWNQIKRFI